MVLGECTDVESEVVYTEQPGRPSSWRVSRFAAAGISVSVTSKL